MGIWTILMVVFGLCLFETVSSIDNAVINAEVLSTMQPKARRWFLVWGIILAVFIVRGLLPWLIIWMTNSSIGPWGPLSLPLAMNLILKNQLNWLPRFY